MVHYGKNHNLTLINYKLLKRQLMYLNKLLNHKSNYLLQNFKTKLFFSKNNNKNVLNI